MVSTLCFLIYLFSIAALYLSKTKTHALLLNISSCSFCGVYLYLEGGYAGVIACIAAASGSAFQLYAMYYLSNFNERKLLLLKCAGSSLFACIGILSIYKTISDFYLALAIIACRGGETLNKPHHVKLSYIFAEVLWMIYAADHGITPLFITHGCMTILGLYVLFKYYLEEDDDIRRMLRLPLPQEK